MRTFNKLNKQMLQHKIIMASQCWCCAYGKNNQIDTNIYIATPQLSSGQSQAGQAVLSVLINPNPKNPKPKPVPTYFNHFQITQEADFQYATLVQPNQMIHAKKKHPSQTKTKAWYAVLLVLIDNHNHKPVHTYFQTTSRLPRKLIFGMQPQINQTR